MTEFGAGRAGEVIGLGSLKNSEALARDEIAIPSWRGAKGTNHYHKQMINMKNVGNCIMIVQRSATTLQGNEECAQQSLLACSWIDHAVPCTASQLPLPLLHRPAPVLVRVAAGSWVSVAEATAAGGDDRAQTVFHNGAVGAVQLQEQQTAATSTRSYTQYRAP